MKELRFVVGFGGWSFWFILPKQKFDLEICFSLLQSARGGVGDLGSHILLGAFYSVCMLPTLEYTSLNPQTLHEPKTHLSHDLLDLSLYRLWRGPAWVITPFFSLVTPTPPKSFSINRGASILLADQAHSLESSLALLYTSSSITSCGSIFQNVSRIWFLQAASTAHSKHSLPALQICCLHTSQKWVFNLFCWLVISLLYSST